MASQDGQETTQILADARQAEASLSTSPSTSFVFAPTRSSLARRPAVLSKDALERHAAGASRYRPRFSSIFDNELFTNGFVPIGVPTKSPEAGPSAEDSNVQVASPTAPNDERAQLKVETRSKRALSQSNVPLTPPPTPYGPPASPAARPQNSESYIRLSLSDLADMVVRASLTPPAVSSPELEAARAYPFPTHHRHRSSSVVSASQLILSVIDHASPYLYSAIPMTP